MKFRFQPMNFDEAAFMVDADDFDSAVNAVNISTQNYLLLPCGDEEADIIGMQLVDLSPTTCAPRDIRSFRMISIHGAAN